MARPIRAAIQSGLFSSVLVSTDDESISEVARACGAEVPFLRPPELADNFTGTTPVVEHAISEMELLGQSYSAVCCLYATAALIGPTELIESSHLVSKAKQCQGVVAAVVRYDHPIQRSLEAREDGVLQPSNPEAIATRTQDLPSRWFDAGQFYWASPSVWRSGSPVLSRVVPYELARWQAVDVDTEEDWEMAEALGQLRS